MTYVSVVKNLPQELQLPILELVESIEENMRAQLAVRREDFAGLRTTVAELATAQQRTEERLARLEAAVIELVAAQQRTERRVEELAAAQQRTEERLARLETVVTELAAAQQRTEERFARLETIVADLAVAQQKTEAALQRLADHVEKMQTRQDRHAGLFLELRYNARPHAYFSRVIRRARSVPFTELEDRLDAEVGEEQADDVARLDAIISGRPKARPDVAEIWLAVEISAVVDRNDVERALRRAKILRRIGLYVVPAVAGEAITEGGYDAAMIEKVALFENGSVRNWEAALAAALDG